MHPKPNAHVRACAICHKRAADAVIAIFNESRGLSKSLLTPQTSEPVLVMDVHRAAWVLGALGAPDRAGEGRVREAMLRLKRVRRAAKPRPLPEKDDARLPGVLERLLKARAYTHMTAPGPRSAPRP